MAKDKFSTEQLEEISVSAVKTYFSRKNYVCPHLAEQDRTPLWDGQLFIYSSKRVFSNENFSFQIPVQVKSANHSSGKFPNRTSHSVSLADLKSYLRDGGLVFFKVLITNETEQIYVNYLDKLSLQRIIESEGNTENRNIQLNKISSSYEDVLNALHRIELQRQNPLIDIKDIPQSFGAVLPKPISYESGNVVEYFATHKVNFLVKTSDGQVFYPSIGEATLHYSDTIDCEVALGDVIYFNKVSFIYESDGCRYKIGNCLTVTIPYTATEGEDGTQADDKPWHFQFELTPHLLSDYIQDLRFINNFRNEVYFRIGNKSLPISGINESEEFFLHCSKIIDGWEAVVKTFTQLGIKKDLDISNLTDEEYSHLNYIVKGILKKQSLNVNFEGEGLLTTKLSNITISLIAKKNSDGTFKFIDIFDKQVGVTYRVDKKQRQTTSIYSMLFEQEQLPDNMQWELLIPQYEYFKNLNSDIFNRANVDLLNLLNHFDKSHCIEWLDAALALSCWIKDNANDKDNEEVYYLNYVQILLRKDGHLSEEIINQILTIATSSRHASVQYGCCVLLSEFKRADFLLSKMSAKDSDFIKTLPIYNLRNN